MVRAIFLGVLLALLSLLAYTITAPFLESLFLGVVFAVITYPYYERILVRTGDRKGIASGLTCLAVGLIIVLPIFSIISVISAKGLFFIEQVMTAGTAEYQFVQNMVSTVASWVPNGQQYVDQPDLLLSKFGIANLAQFGAAFFRAAYSGLVEIMLGTIVVMFVLFYAYIDGRKFLVHLKRVSPLDDRHEEQLFQEFASMSRAMVKGTLLIGFGQGIASGVVLYAVGIDGAWLWMLIMIVLAIIPVAGANLVMWPIGILQIVSGNLLAGVVILVASFVIGVVDNFVRPKIVGRDVQMHSGLILLSLMGGLIVWGPIGFIEGPIVWALCIAIWDIFEVEFRDNCHGSLNGKTASWEEELLP